MNAPDFGYGRPWLQTTTITVKTVKSNHPCPGEGCYQYVSGNKICCRSCFEKKLLEFPDAKNTA